MTNIIESFYGTIESLSETAHKLLFKNKYLSYEYDKYLYNLKIDIKEHSMHFIQSLIRNNKTHNDIKKIAVTELEDRPMRILEQDKYLKNIIKACLSLVLIILFLFFSMN
jgi:hypothetical protein